MSQKPSNQEPHLYELTGELVALQKLAESEDGIPDEAFNDTWESLMFPVEQKAEALLKVVKNMDSSVEILDKEIKRLTARKTAIKNRQDSLREYLRMNMVRGNINKITCPLFGITLAKATDQLEITDEKELPDDYMKVETVITPKKKELLDALKQLKAITAQMKEDGGDPNEIGKLLKDIPGIEYDDQGFPYLPGAKIIEGKRSLRIK